MARDVATLALAIVLLLLPALCSGGWLYHPCECGPDVACEHESACDSDPCQTGIARPESDVPSNDGSAAALPTVGVAPDTDGSAIAEPSPPARAQSHARGPQVGRPFPPSDLPQLN